MTEDDLLAKLYADGALEELAVSFGRSGYFWEEPIVVVPSPTAGKFVVVEGNRRLATLKLLLSPAKRAVVGAEDFPQLDDARLLTLRDVPTVEYASRSDVIPYLGFRHITGVKKWEPYPRARYISKLVDSGQTFDAIESAIGDSAKTAKKLYQAFVVFQQIRADSDLDVHNVRESFSLLEVLLGQQNIKNHLGVPKRLPEGKIDAIIDEGHVVALRETVKWVFGSKKRSVQPVIHESREISKWLAPVIGNAEALVYLRENGDLEGAFERIGGDREYLLKQLTKARKASERALAISPQCSGDPGAKSEATRLANVVKAIEDVLRG